MNSRLFIYWFIIDTALKGILKSANSLIKGIRGWFKWYWNEWKNFINHMMRKEIGKQDMNGIINLKKEAGMTSHDVVFKLRKILGTKRIGQGER